MTDKCLRCGNENEVAREVVGNYICWQCRRTENIEKAKIKRENERRSGCNLYPKVCEFVGVHPNQIPEASRFLEQRGVEPSFNRDGDFCPQSKKHYKQYQKVMGLHENDKKHGRMLKKH